MLTCLPEIFLRQTEEVRVADASDVRSPAVPRFHAGDVQQAQLSEDAAVAERRKYRPAVVCNHLQTAPLHDVHFLAHVACGKKEFLEALIHRDVQTHIATCKCILA
ncbi:hypothetical protein AVEN_35299-1 [Araneus ventricosus]|uniref:Uncharacterized protein n=1 Tax=Araneus ventricosus TaxID=182803 RepID=A0A4Y2V4C8_ARAVE|nr:hypothetical protein AVEN_35299-1 [Araneus ventricosus]